MRDETRAGSELKGSVRPTLGSLILKVLAEFGPHSVKGIHYLLNRESLWVGWSRQISQALQGLQKAGKAARDEHGRWHTAQRPALTGHGAAGVRR